MPNWKTACARARRSSSDRPPKLVESEQRRSMAIAAGKMGSWDWNWVDGDWMWDDGQYRIFGVDPASFEVTSANIQALLHPDDVEALRKIVTDFTKGARSYEAEFRINRPDGEQRWCVGTAAATTDRSGRVVRLSGVTVDITERKRAEERQSLLTREVDHRAKNALTLAQSIVRLTRADDVKTYVDAVEGRINALARVHTILSLSSWQGAEIGRLVAEEVAPYSAGGQIRSVRLRGPVAARDRANAGARPARARHQFGQVRRAVDLVGAIVDCVERRERHACPDLDRNRRAQGSRADVAGIWHQKPDRKRRVAARRQARYSTGAPKAWSAGCRFRSPRTEPSDSPTVISHQPPMAAPANPRCDPPALKRDQIELSRRRKSAPSPRSYGERVG